MEEIFRRYPMGIQNFEDLRNNDYVYVDSLRPKATIISGSLSGHRPF